MTFSYKSVRSISLIATTSLVLLGAVFVSPPAEAREMVNTQEISPAPLPVEGTLTVTTSSTKAIIRGEDGNITATLTQPGVLTTKQLTPEKAVRAAGKLIPKDAHKKLTTATKGTLIVTSAIADGTQTLILISDNTAAHDIKFNLDVKPDLTPVLASDGAINYIDKIGASVAGVRAPWARDSQGLSIPTSFTLIGNTLVQHIGFDAKNSYPIIADPQWWQLTSSAAAGAAVGAAIVIGIPGVGPTIGAIVGGCVVGALNALWDRKGFWGAFWGCAVGAALGAVGGMVGSIVKNVLRARGIGGI